MVGEAMLILQFALSGFWVFCGFVTLMAMAIASETATTMWHSTMEWLATRRKDDHE